MQSRVAGALFLLWAAAALVFFRHPIFSGLRTITGDNGDTRLIIYLHEHWLLVLRGLASWRDPAFFFPATDTLGYSDTFILDALFYAPLRLAGLDTYVAFQWTLVLLSLIGFIGTYRLLRWVLPEQRWICAGLALTFTFSNMLYVQAGHSQLYSVYWLPLIVILVLRARSEQRLGPAFLAGLLLGILFLSTFYVAWFFVLSSLIWYVARRRLTPGRTAWRQGLKGFWIGHRRRILAFAAGTSIGGVPFLVVYLPTLGQGSRSLESVLGYAAQPTDVLNTGAHNYFWGPITRGIFGSSARIFNGELGFGLTPVLLISLLVATIYFIRRFRAGPSDERIGAAPLATVITCWAAILLPLKMFGVSLWIIIWLVVPGAHAIRAVDRMGVIAGLLAPVVIAIAIADLQQRGAFRRGVRRRIEFASAAIVVLIALEQLNVGNNATINRPAELAGLSSVPMPPSTCQVFYLTVSKNHPPLAYVASIDAMLISQSITSQGTPIATINGFSGQFPLGFGSVADPGSVAYDSDLRAWIGAHEMTAGVCGYDPVAQRWTS